MAALVAYVDAAGAPPSSWRVARWAVASRLPTVALALGGHLLLPDHQATGVHRLSGVPADSPGGAFIKWDAAWMLDIAINGYPQPKQQQQHSDVSNFEEQAHAFFPLYPWVARYAGRGLRLVWPQLTPATAVVAAAVAVSNASFVLSAVALYRLSCCALGSQRAAQWTALAYCFNPASIFFSTAYSESLYALLTFLAFALLLGPAAATCHPWRRGALACISALLLCGATATRSNGVSNALVFCVQQLLWLKQSASGSGRHAFRAAQMVCMLGNLCIIAAQCLLIVSPSALFQLYGYYKFCKK